MRSGPQPRSAAESVRIGANLILDLSLDLILEPILDLMPEPGLDFTG
jgi:hypothetical protein